MMNYESFKEIVMKEFKGYLSKEFQNMQLVFDSMDNINCTLDSIILKSETEWENISPVVYINTMYDAYLKGEDLYNILQDAAKMLEQHFQNTPPLQINFSDARHNIVFQMINTEQNREMLKNMPNREFLDLSITYRWIVDMENGLFRSVKVNNVLAEKMGLNESQLYHLALENTRRLLPLCVKPLTEVLSGICNDIPIEFMGNGEGENLNWTWLISNEFGSNGAYAILYEDCLHTLAQQLGANLYILPSSIHEILAIPSNIGNAEELAEIVLTINMAEVNLKDRLSNQVYHYDRNLREITLATNTPHKSLNNY